MDYCSIMYNINGGNLVNDKMNRIKDFTRLVTIAEDSNCKTYTDNEITKLENIVKSCKDSGDYVSLIRSIPVRNDDLFERYLYTFYLLVYLFIKSDKDISIANYDNIRNHLNNFEIIVKQDKNLLNNDFVDEIISNVGHYVNTIERQVNDMTTDYVYYVSPKTLHSVTSITESVIMDVDSSENKIISSSDPDGSKTSVDINIGDNPSDFIQDIFNEDDHDYFVHKIGRLYNYLLSLQGNFDDIHTKAFIEAVNYIMSKIMNDITAKEILIATLSKCDNLLSNIIPNSDESLNNIEIIVDKIEEITDVIHEYPQGEVSLLDEMGLGYIYDCIPKVINEDTDIDAIVSYLNECANKNDMVSTIGESINILNEGIKDNINNYINKKKERHEKEKNFKEQVKDEKYKLHDDTYDTRVDIARRRQNDEYDDNHNMQQRKINDKYDYKHQKKNDRYDFSQQKKQDRYSDNRDMSNIKSHDKYDYKQQKKLDKYDFKKQKKLDKYEQKKSYAEEDRARKLAIADEKRQARLEARQRRRDETKIGLNRWKTLELTNANARKAANALRKVVKAGAAAGVGALAGFNPIFAGATYLIGSYLKDKTNPREERRKIVDDMRLQLTEIDEKIDQADRKGENDKKIALMKMRKKIETAYNRTGHLHKMELEM